MHVSIFRRVWVMFFASIIGLYAHLLNRLKVVGAEQLPEEGGVLIAANHISAYDTVFLPVAVFHRHPFQMVWAPAKEELFQNRFLGWVFSTLGAFPVRRGRDIRAGKQLGDLLQTEKVMLFPEGTRNREGKLGKGNRGVGKLIYDHRPVVIPAALSGVNRWRFPGVAQKGMIHFGAAVDFSDLLLLDDCKATHVRIVERLMAAIADGLEQNQHP